MLQLWQISPKAISDHSHAILTQLSKTALNLTDCNIFYLSRNASVSFYRIVTLISRSNFIHYIWKLQRDSACFSQNNAANLSALPLSFAVLPYSRFYLYYFIPQAPFGKKALGSTNWFRYYSLPNQYPKNQTLQP